MTDTNTDFLSRRGFTYYQNKSLHVFSLEPRGNPPKLQLMKDEIEAIERIGKIVTVLASFSEDKPYIRVELEKES